MIAVVSVDYVMHYAAACISKLICFNVLYCIVLYCIIFIQFYSASHSMNLSETLPTTATNTVLEFTS